MIQVKEMLQDKDLKYSKSEDEGSRVEQLELDKVSQAMEITTLKQRVKKLEKRNKVVDVITTAKIITEVVTAASKTITAADVQVLAATAASSTLIATPSRRRKGVVIRDLEES
nr:hypothetical protein [Tanacetum cinerariifolium]